MTVTVVLVDDHELMRTGLRLILDGAPDIDVVGEVADGDEVLDVVAELDPDLVLMDIRMSRVDGIEATRRITAAQRRSRVLILTTYDLDEHLYKAMRAGACGFVLKTAPPDQLLAAIRTAAAGDAVLAPSITRRLLEQYVSVGADNDSDDNERQRALSERLTGLSHREVEVLALLATGLSNEEIASRLFVSAATVKSHVNAIFRKLAVRDRVQAVIFAYESGLVS